MTKTHRPFWPIGLSLAGILFAVLDSAEGATSLDSVLQFIPQTERPEFDRRARNFVLQGVIHNKSNAAVAAPISLAVTALSPNQSSLRLATVHGHLANGAPYVEVQKSGQIEPGADLPVAVRFNFASSLSRVATVALERIADRSFRAYTPNVLAAFAVDYDLIRVPAGNHPPVAHAGNAWTTTPDQPLTLDGSLSSDEDGHALTYQWTLTQKPVLSQRTLEAPNNATTAFTPDALGDYVATLVVSDGYEESPPDTVAIKVNPDGNTQQNQNPVITSAPNTSATGTRAYSYQVRAADPDDPNATLAYRLITRPSGMTIGPSGLIEWMPPQPHHNGMAYPVEVEVTDGQGGIVTQSFSISVATCTCA